MDEDTLTRDDLIGTATISLARTREQGHEVVQAPVYTKHYKAKGFVQLSLTFTPNSRLRPGAAAAPVAYGYPAAAQPACGACSGGYAGAYGQPQPAAYAPAPSFYYPPPVAQAPAYAYAAPTPPAYGYGYPPAAYQSSASYSYPPPAPAPQPAYQQSASYHYPPAAAAPAPAAYPGYSAPPAYPGYPAYGAVYGKSS